MGGGGGSLGGFMPYFGTNLGNTNLTDTGQQAVANLFDPTGMTSFTLANWMGPQGQEEIEYVEGGEAAKPKYPENVPDPAIAAKAASDKSTEEARQEEMRKRRIRTKTLLSDQENQGTATVGTKTLLGG